MPSTKVHALLGPVPTGTLVGSWTVVREAPHQFGMRHLTCRCVCGKERDVFIGNLRTGMSSSCGCQSKAKTHGMSTWPEYRIWIAMKGRCHNPNTTEFENYGGRGIQVCEEWRNSFRAFIEHIGRRPSPKLTIERINNDRNYEPGNVKWATRKEQESNKRTTQADRVRQGRINAMKRWHPEAVSER